MYDPTMTGTVQYQTASGKFWVILRQPRTQIDSQKVNSLPEVAAMLRRWKANPAKIVTLDAA